MNTMFEIFSNLLYFFIDHPLIMVLILIIIICGLFMIIWDVSLYDLKEEISGFFKTLNQQEKVEKEDNERF